MNQTTRTILIAFGTVVTGAILLLGGMFIGRSTLGLGGFWPGSMMGGGFAPAGLSQAETQFNYRMGSGMMGAYGQPGQEDLYSGYGMMGSGMMGSGMMGGFGTSGLLEVAPLTPAEAQQAVQDYLAGLNNPDLAIGEIMIFDNHAYAQIVESNTGIGAMEVLVDPVTKAVYPEHGPNMMWNLKYSPMSGYGMMGMMGGVGQNSGGMMGRTQGSLSTEEISADMPVTPEKAVTAAQDYLDVYLPGTEADDHADPFYGYYTLHILRDGKVAGMLSVNGYTKAVFPHTWHGDFLEMAESNAE